MLLVNKDVVITLLTQIDACLQKRCVDEPTLPSLADGHIGLSLFYGCYYQMTRDIAHLDLCNSLLTNCFTTITNSNVPDTFASGIAGAGWVLQYLSETGAVEVDENFLDEVDEYLEEVALHQTTLGNYDFLHGGVGYGIYFLGRKKERDYRTLIGIVDRLNKTAKVVEEGIFWPDTSSNFGKKHKDVVNFGLAHGIPSIIVFLSKVYSESIIKDRCSVLLNGCVNFILSYFAKDKKSTSCLPQMFRYSDKSELNYNGRLAWCYGDLSIAVALYQASIALVRDDWKEIAISIAVSTTKRIHYKETFIEDGGICHGIAGVAHIYKKFYHWTGDVLFSESASYWYNQLINYIEYRDVEDFSEWDPSQSKWVNSFGFLTGLAGVGISLVNAVSDDVDTKWDRCLLLS